jgi:hypothetical protein
MGTILVTAPMLGIAEDWSSCNKHNGLGYVVIITEVLCCRFVRNITGMVITT